MGLLY